MTVTTSVGRLQLLHPNLGEPGGSDLHTAVRAAWTRISDSSNSRYFSQAALADAASVDFEHNFKTAFGELRYMLYSWNTGTGELTRIVTGGSPDLANFTIAATPGSLTTQIRVTNNTGGAEDIALVVVHGRGPEVLSDLDDFDNTGVANGYVPVWVAANNQYEPQANAPTSWNTVIKVATYTAADKDEVLADTSGGAFSFDLPPAAPIGARVRVIDYGNNFGANTLTVGRNGATIMGVAANYVFNTNGDGAEFISTGAGDWRVL